MQFATIQFAIAHQLAYIYLTIIFILQIKKEDYLEDGLNVQNLDTNSH